VPVRGRDFGRGRPYQCLRLHRGSMNSKLFVLSVARFRKQERFCQLVMVILVLFHYLLLPNALAKKVQLQRASESRIPAAQNLQLGATVCEVAPSLVIFAHYGVLERSRGCEREANELNIYRAATLNYTIPHVHIGFGIDMNGHPIDGVSVPTVSSKEHVRALGLSDFRYKTVTEIDNNINEAYCNSRKPVRQKMCENPFWRSDYSTHKTMRALRAMYCERGISRMLEKFDNQSAIVVVTMSADIMLNTALQMSDIYAAACAKDKIFLTKNNDGADGYTDGFYLGHIDAMKSILSTYDLLPVHYDAGRREQPYEFLLKATCVHLNITRSILAGFGFFLHDFVKIRANGAVFGNLQCCTKSLINTTACPQLKHARCMSGVE